MLRKSERVLKNIGIFVLLAVFIFSSAGCETLRKKFTRAKKNDKSQSDAMPILNPIDYPTKTYTAQEIYKKNYSVWKAWDKDLAQAIAEGGSDKKQKYDLNQMIIQLGGMRDLLSQEKAKELGFLVDDLSQLLTELDKPASVRNISQFKTRLDLNSKKVRNQFSPRLPLPYKEQK